MNCTTIYNTKSISTLQAILQVIDEELALFIPKNLYTFTEEDYQKMQGMMFAERLAYILHFFFEGELDFATLKTECEKGMQNFGNDDPLPLVKIDDKLFIAELFYGQTHSLYDFANTLFPFIYQHAYQKYGEGKKPLFFSATDINSASSIANAMQTYKEMETKILYPTAFASKLQMIELANKNGNNIEILPIDAADLEDVEEILLQFLKENRKKLEEKYCITVLGEWNIFNILVQVAIIVSSYVDILAAKEVSKTQKLNVVIPMEHYSNFIALLYAKQMGLPVQNIIVGLNSNAMIYKALQTGNFARQDSTLTISPAMDSNLSYNIFRMLALFDSSAIQEQMHAYMHKNPFQLSGLQKEGLNKNIHFVSAKEDEQIDSIYNFFEEYTYLLDTHTACGEHAYQSLVENRVLTNEMRILFATVNPFKYPQDAMYAVTGEDIKDTFKTIKHLEEATAMQAPKSIKKLRTMQKELEVVSIENCKLYLKNLLKRVS